jgi:hypothetical protein
LYGESFLAMERSVMATASVKSRNGIHVMPL